jgi:NitT/TauT family transport system ATP-binding protein
MAKLVARGVKKVFAPTRAGQRPVTALNGISFDVEGHTFVSLVGPSGCGKSTFLNIVSGVDHPTDGSLDVTADDGSRATIGYVFQDPRLLPWQTVINNMLYVQDDGGKDEQRTKAQHYLDLVGLGAAGGMYPGQLSGGMQQRVGIARALSIKPDLLLMDEPFSHLDAITARGLREELQRLWQTAGATVLFVTHDVMEAVQLSNRVLMMSSAGVIYRDLTIELPYPRRQTDHAVAAQQVEILELFEVMEQRTAVESASAG